MSEEFDADAEAALDALLARHQSSLAATVGPALDVLAGLGRTSKLKGSLVEYVVDVRAAQSIANGRDLVPWVVNCEVSVAAAESSSLNSVLDSVRHEHNELGRFEHQLVVRSATGSLETDALTVRAAVSGARDELNRILLLLSDGEVTKESARAEFKPALKFLEGQLRARYAEDLERGNELPDWVLWINDCLDTRIRGLMRLREQVVRLFEDSDACAFQLS
ncbi:hypothetical protein [Streptomyces sp. NPDC058583]|uniref:hypothetical protein n=1 Tax=unclassified Streptomyces TaxID=2593676 RepID=UPI003653FDE8